MYYFVLFATLLLSSGAWAENNEENDSDDWDNTPGLQILVPGIQPFVEKQLAERKLPAETNAQIVEFLFNNSCECVKLFGTLKSDPKAWNVIQDIFEESYTKFNVSKNMQNVIKIAHFTKASLNNMYELLDEKTPNEAKEIAQGLLAICHTSTLMNENDQNRVNYFLDTHNCTKENIEIFKQWADFATTGLEVLVPGLTEFTMNQLTKQNLPEKTKEQIRNFLFNNWCRCNTVFTTLKSDAKVWNIIQKIIEEGYEKFKVSENMKKVIKTMRFTNENMNNIYELLADKTPNEAKDIADGLLSVCDISTKMTEKEQSQLSDFLVTFNCTEENIEVYKAIVDTY